MIARARPRPAGQPRRDESRGMYRVIAAPAGGLCKAAAYAGMRRIEMADAESLDGAFDAVVARLEARVRAHRSARVDGWPGAEEYRDAIEAAPLQGSARLMSILRAHVYRPDARSTWGDLAQAVGASEADVRLEYARLGRKLARFLDLPADPTLGRELAPVNTFAHVGEAGHAAAIRLRRAVVEALEDL